MEFDTPAFNKKKKEKKGNNNLPLQKKQKKNNNTQLKKLTLLSTVNLKTMLCFIVRIFP